MSTATELVDVGAVGDFHEGTMRVATVEDRQIGVVLWRERWYAMRNVCPHMGAPVCNGTTLAFLRSEGPAWADPIRSDAERPVLMCPWHRWEFDLETGRHVAGRERIRMYPVVVEDGRVLVDTA